MKIKDLKYFAAFILPLCAYYSIVMTGGASFLNVVVAFGLLPALEIILPVKPENLSKEEAEAKNVQKIFDLLLYVNVPIIAFLIYTYFIRMPFFNGWVDWVGSTASLGIILSTNGINVAHELGHKNSKLARFAAKILLLPSHYMHFIIEHNLGHHLNVSTPEDPATSRKGEIIYFFWIRSTVQSYFSAWKIENKIQKKEGRSIVNINNRMIQFSLFHLIYLGAIYFFFGFAGLLGALAFGTISFLLLECINYVEHYGLMRKKKANGKYEIVTHKHSWNSDHQLGRIMLYELTRHSDHHARSTKKFQILDSYEDSPNLPLGYPGSILLSLVPPLWFKIMDKKVESWTTA